ncbi:Stealth CR1 domain-containing protein [Anderseniella sp. Alg231-50]|uniref:Stealth CR1 domain-containing protein n=1 Tax=Anderseniella sp. Alg231-50 TaxID=1922226 RepID=UPI00307B5C79
MIDVDAVVTWVDGADQTHARKRQSFMALSQSELHENAINPHRWVDNNELHYCLRSIQVNAPWIRRIWLVTDNQTPDISAFSQKFRDKIQIVDHVGIFAGFTEFLPTFNSLAIESLLWRIPDLAEHFVYFNDDVFVSSPVRKTDFFKDGEPVLRGKWVDYSELAGSAERRRDPALMNHYNQIEAAELAGFDAGNLFCSAHAIHPMNKSVMARLFEDHQPAFMNNIAHRFRVTDQFLPQGLYNHASIRTGKARILDKRDHIHLASGAFDKWSTREVTDHLLKAATPDIKFLCVNDLPGVEQNIPDARDLIEEIIGA